MRGRDRILAALSPEGTPEIPAVIPYEDIFGRDHWGAVTRHPWWYMFSPDTAHQLAWRRDAIAAVGQDWFELPLWRTADERALLAIEERANGVYLLDRARGAVRRLTPPRIGGWSPGSTVESIRPDPAPRSRDDVDELVPSPTGDPTAVLRDGRGDLAADLLAEFGADLAPMAQVSAPLWSCYQLFGFEGLMEAIAMDRALVAYACGRLLDRAVFRIRQLAALGVAVIWLEECMTDLVSPDAFLALDVPYVAELVGEIRALGMASIHYYCGNPAGKWEHLMAAGADALALEESKKGFVVDIEDVVEHVGGRCAVLGNLDALHLLEHGDDDALRAEVARQIAAGRRNGSRFIMSLGSPVTPGTTLERVRRYCDLVHELGR